MIFFNVAGLEYKQSIRIRHSQNAGDQLELGQGAENPKFERRGQIETIQAGTTSCLTKSHSELALMDASLPQWPMRPILGKELHQA